MVKLCVFDLDGTTVDTLASIAYFANRILERNGYETFPVDDYRRLAGGGSKKLWNNISERRAIPDGLNEKFREEWIAEYAADYMHLTVSFPGVAEMLSDLRKAGIATAIVTNKDKRIADRICGTLFPGLLDDVVSDHPGMILKPDPGEILALGEKYGAGDRQLLYCGDHEIDMITGKRAGALTVGVTWGFFPEDKLREAGADEIAFTPADVTRIAINFER